jgi:hypothetical protein
MSTKIVKERNIGLIHLESFKAPFGCWVHSKDHSIDTVAISSGKQPVSAKRETNLPFLSTVEPNGRRRIGDGEVEGRVRGVGGRTETRVSTWAKGRARVRKGRLGDSLIVQI